MKLFNRGAKTGDEASSRPDTEVETTGSIAAVSSMLGEHESSAPKSRRAAKAPAAAKPKPKSQTLSSVMRESVPAPAIERVKTNEKFLVKNGTAGLVLVLDVADIGGLSTKDRKDETKGSIVQQIKGDFIQVVISKPMMEAEVMAIVPTPSSLDHMEEYSLLSNAPYSLGVMNLYTQGIEIDSYGPVSFKDMTEVASGRIDAEELLERCVAGTPVAAPAEPKADEDEDHTAVRAAVTAPADDEDAADDGIVDDMDPTGDDEEPEAAVRGGATAHVPDVDTDEVDPDERENYDDEVDASESWAAMEADQADDDGIVDELDEEPSEAYEPADEADWTEQGRDEEPETMAPNETYDDRVVDRIEVASTIARRFKSDDLDLAVDMKPLEEFLGLNDDRIIVYFNETADEDDWLGRQVAEIGARGNMDIDAVDSRSRNELRQAYMSMVSLHIENTMAKLDLSDPRTFYGDLKLKARHDFDQRTSKIEQEKHLAQQAIIERFTKDAEQAGEAGKAMAIQQFIERNGARRDRELSEVGTDLVIRNEATYDANLDDLRAARRAEAAKAMELGLTQILAALGERRSADLAEIEAVRARVNAEIRKLVDECREDDQHRIEALREQLSRQNEVAEAEKVHRARIEALTAESNARVEALTQQMEEDRRIQQAQLAERDRLHQIDMEQRNAEIAAQREQIADLQQNAVELVKSSNKVEKKVRKQISDELEATYARQIADMNAAVERARDEARNAKSDIERVRVTERTVKIVLASMCVVLFLVGILLGVVIHSHM